MIEAHRHRLDGLSIRRGSCWFKPAAICGLQLFASIQSATRNCFSVPARRRAALTIRYHRMEALRAWKAAASVA